MNNGATSGQRDNFGTTSGRNMGTWDRTRDESRGTRTNGNVTGYKAAPVVRRVYTSVRGTNDGAVSPEPRTSPAIGWRDKASSIQNKIERAREKVVCHNFSRNPRGQFILNHGGKGLL